MKLQQKDKQYSPLFGVAQKIDNRQLLSQNRLIQGDQQKLSKKQNNQVSRKVHGIPKKVKLSIDYLKSTVPKGQLRGVVKLLFNNINVKNIGQVSTQIQVPLNTIINADFQHQQQHKNEIQAIKTQQKLQNQKQINSIEFKQKNVPQNYPKEAIQIDQVKIENNSFNNIDGVVKIFMLNQQKSIKKVTPNSIKKLKMKQIVVRSLCEVGYGISTFENWIALHKLQLQIDSQRYKSLAFSVATQAFRNLQIFLINDCQQKIDPVDQNIMRSMACYIANCRRYFQPKDVQVFQKFMKAAFNLQTVRVTQTESKRLYQSIEGLVNYKLQGKKINQVFNQVYQINDLPKRPTQLTPPEILWDFEREAELLTAYRHYQYMKAVQDYFFEKYPKNKDMFTVKKIRSKFQQILKKLLAKMEKYSKEWKGAVPVMTAKINESTFDELCRSPELHYIRLDLIELFKQKVWDNKLVSKIINSINTEMGEEVMLSSLLTLPQKQRLGIQETGIVFDKVATIQKLKVIKQKAVQVEAQQEKPAVQNIYSFIQSQKVDEQQKTPAYNIAEHIQKRVIQKIVTLDDKPTGINTTLDCAQLEGPRQQKQQGTPSKSTVFNYVDYVQNRTKQTGALNKPAPFITAKSIQQINQQKTKLVKAQLKSAAKHKNLFFNKKVGEIQTQRKHTITFTK